MKYAFLFILIAAILLLQQTPAPALAADSMNCYQLYNGGITDKHFCPTPTPGTHPLPSANNQTPQRTKGGQVVYPASQSRTTPSTGPEAWTIAALLPIAGLGFLLRNKALGVSQK